MSEPCGDGWDFDVTLTVRLSMNVYFGSTDPPRTPTRADAIELAIARLYESGAIEAIKSYTSFEVALPIDGEAKEA